MKFIQIQWTCANLEEAKKIAKALVEKRWVGCANLFPHIESIYLWEGKVQEGREVKVFFKTTDAYFPKVRDYILAHCSYQVPEISKVAVVDVHQPYLDWLLDTLAPL